MYIIKGGERTGVKGRLIGRRTGGTCYTVPIKIIDLDTLEKLMELSKEFGKTFDQLVLLALQKLFSDVEIVRRLWE